MLVSPIPFLYPNIACLEHIDEHIDRAKNHSVPLPEIKDYQELPSSILVYRISNSQHSHTGIVLGVDIQAFLYNQIVDHEKTISEKVQKQAAIAALHKGFSKPILLTHRPLDKIKRITQSVIQNPPLFDVQLSKYASKHEIWNISSKEDIEVIQNTFQPLQNLYIVDGHHRTAALRQLVTNNTLRFKHGMCALFDTDQLEILAFHRLVELDKPINISEFIHALSNLGTISILDNKRKPGGVHEIILIHNEIFYSFRWKMELLDQNYGADKLDVNLLTHNVFHQILNLQRQNPDHSISYLEGNQSLDFLQSLADTPNKIAFLLYPLTMKDVVDITDNDEILPPKSTFFLPRLVNGLLCMTAQE